MLAITDTAAEAIKSLTTDAELPDGGGLRIAATDPEQGLELSLAAQADQRRAAWLSLCGAGNSPTA